ncbi:MAG: hypothetical protein ACOVMH_10450 [Flavobacterium sp.]
MKKIVLFLFFIFSSFLFSQTVSLSSNTTWGSNCGNGHAPTTITINGDLNLNGRTLTLKNVNLIVNGNLNGGGSIDNGCSNNPSTYCVRGNIQNNPSISVTRNFDCTPQPPCTKTWTGAQNNNWNNNANWTPTGVPTINCDVIINNAIGCVISTTNAEAKTITLSNTASLNIINAGIVRVKGTIQTAATANFTIENASSLIQVDDVTNTGNITMKRTTSINRLDYVYWSSPVENFNVSSISPNSNLIFKWIPTVGSNQNGFGNWVGASNEIMVKGKGYIVRGPNNFSPTTNQDFTATFKGTANNGTVLTPISRGVYNGPNYMNGGTMATRDDDNWNLIGNPYPSAIDAVRFLTANPDLDGMVRVWTHSSSISNANSNPFYGNFAYNYSPSDYLIINGTGTSRPGALGVVGAAQGFFVKMRNDSPTANSNAVFTNNMRGTGVSNQQFFRNATSSENSETDEKHRIWLNLVNPNQIATSMLVGYVTDATNGIDRIFDAETDLKPNFQLFSLIDNQYFSIQGRTLPFTATDEIPLGYSADQNGTYTFGIAAVDGLFETNQPVYIQDLALGVTHNLKESPYSFTTNQGNYNTRFVLKFSNEILSNEDFTNTNATLIFTNEFINIKANKNIKEVTIYDTLGRVLIQNKKVDALDYSENQIKKSGSPLIVELILEDNTQITKKIIF